jgi:hypothetical protein
MHPSACFTNQCKILYTLDQTHITNIAHLGQSVSRLHIVRSISWAPMSWLYVNDISCGLVVSRRLFFLGQKVKGQCTLAIGIYCPLNILRTDAKGVHCNILRSRWPQFILISKGQGPNWTKEYTVPYSLGPFVILWVFHDHFGFFAELYSLNGSD